MDIMSLGEQCKGMRCVNMKKGCNGNGNNKKEYEEIANTLELQFENVNK